MIKCYKKVPCRYHDPNNPAYHGVYDLDQAIEGAIKEWQENAHKLPAEQRNYLCKHGCYGGVDACLADLFCCWCRKEKEDEQE